MSRIAEIFHRLRYNATRRRADRELDEEMQLHVEARAEELTREGVSGSDALARARREFGNSVRAREDSRSAWQFTWIEDLLADARYAARSFRRDPGFAATAVMCLALGIGANALVFSLASEVLFSAPSVRNPLTLAHVRLGGNSHVRLREYRFVRDSGVFTGLGGENEESEVNWRHGDASERLFAMRVTGNFFQVTGIPVALGRPFAPDDAASVAISFRLWQSRFAGDRGVIGRKMILDGAPYSIACVLPADHRTVIGFGFSPDLYVPLADDRDPRAIVALYGRARDGMTRGELVARVRAVAEALDRTYPDPNVKWARDLTVAPLAGIDRLRGESEMTVMAAFFAMLMAVVGLVLLIACANVASLLLARAATRSHEFAIRLSIGAGRGRILRQLLAESLLLACGGAAAGLALSVAGSGLLSRIRLPLPVPIQFAIEPNWRLLVYLVAVSVACAVAAGFAPALSAARRGLAATLQLDSNRGGGGRSRLRSALVVAQLAVSVILLAAGFIFLRNLLQASSMSPGFDANRSIWAFMRLVPEAYPQPARVDALIATALEKLRAVPGVPSAAIARVVPLNDNMHASTEVMADGAAKRVRVQFHYNFVSGDYFQTLGIPMLAGREFEKSDRNVAILNRNLARELFGDVSPIGHSVRFGDGKPLQIVGVAANSKYFTLGEERPFALYQPYGESARSIENLHFLLRTPLDPESLVPAINRTLGALDSTAAIETRPMSRALALAMLPSQAGAALLGSIGLLGLALASIGLYGTLAYAVSRRIREIGLRVALGASPGKVLGLVLRQSSALAGAGLAIGLILAAIVVRPLALFLIPEVRPGDPTNFLAVAAILGFVSLAAALAPAIRALRIEPTVALRHE
jgi:predicted permease